jgi:hypothetical protein
LLSLIRQSPVLSEIEPLSELLAGVAELGLECLDWLDQAEKPGQAWRDKGEKLLKRAKEPYALVELMVVPGIERLFRAVVARGENTRAGQDENKSG